MSTGAGTTAPTEGPIRDQAVRGVFWTTIEKWSVRLSTFIGFVILGNLLSPAAFGVVALAMSFITILITVTDAGFSTYLIQLRRLTDTATSTAFWISLAISLVLAAALAGFAGLIAAGLDTPELALVLPALAVSLVVAGLTSVQLMLLRRALRFKELAKRQVVATVVAVVVAVSLAFAGAGVWALVAQTLVRGLVALVILWRTSDFRPRWVFDRTEARAMTSYGVQSLGAQLSNQLRGQGEVFLIGALAGPVALGYWTIATRLVNVVVDTLTSVINVVAMPVFARLQEDRSRLTRALGTAQGTSTFIVGPVLVALSLVSDEVVPAVFGDQWQLSAALASILALRSLFQTLSSLNSSALLATGHPRPELLLNLATLAIQLALVVWLVDVLLVLAGALAALLALTIPIRIAIVRHLVGVQLRAYRMSAAVLLALGVSVGVVLGVSALTGLQGVAHVGLVLGLGGVVYAGMALLVCRPVLREIAGVLRSGLRRRKKATP